MSIYPVRLNFFQIIYALVQGFTTPAIDVIDDLLGNKGIGSKNFPLFFTLDESKLMKVRAFNTPLPQLYARGLR